MKDKAICKALWVLFRKSFCNQISIAYEKPFAKATMKKAKLYYNEIYRNTLQVGNHNPKIIDILFAAFLASIYKGSDKKISVEKMKQIMINGLKTVYIFRRFAQKEDHFSKKWQDKRNAQALVTQQKQYPDDFVCEFKYGETLNEYGIIYYECALYKLLKREDCAELTPLLCEFDYIMAEYMNATLKRTKTVATGGDCCDFHYVKKVE